MRLVSRGHTARAKWRAGYSRLHLTISPSGWLCMWNNVTTYNSLSPLMLYPMWVGAFYDKINIISYIFVTIPLGCIFNNLYNTYMRVCVLSYFQALLMYAAFFFTNMGNYKSFGDTKVVPSLGKVPDPHRKTCSCSGRGTCSSTVSTDVCTWSYTCFGVHGVRLLCLSSYLYNRRCLVQL